MNVQKMEFYVEKIPYSKNTVISKSSDTTKAVAASALLTLGSVYLTLHYAIPMKDFLDTSLVPLNAIGISLIALGSLVYLKTLCDSQKNSQTLSKNLDQANQKIENLISERNVLIKINKKIKRFCFDGNVFFIKKKYEKAGCFKKVFFGYSLDSQNVAVSVLVNNNFRISSDMVEKWKKSSINALQISKVLAFDEKNQVLVQPKYNYRGLHHYIGTSTPLSDSQVFSVVSDLLNGYASLHENGLVHGDPKPDNVMLHKEKKGIEAKIIDLDMISMKDDPAVKIGAVLYRAPEVLWNKWKTPFDKQKAEVWSVGLMIAMILINKEFFIDKLNRLFPDYYENEDIQTILQDHLKKTTKSTPTFKDFSNMLKSWKWFHLNSCYTRFKPMLKKMLKTNPDKRCTMHEAINYFEYCKK